jgi:DNA repair protein RadC
MHDPPSLFTEKTVFQLPEHETPAHRLAEHSADYLSDSELLSLLLKGALPKSEAMDTARRLMCRHGSLTALSRLTLDELQSVRGIGPASASAIHSALALAGRLGRETRARGIRMTSPRAVVDYLRDEFRPLTQENFTVLLLNTKHHLIQCKRVTQGLVDRSQVHAREVFRPAIRASCSRVILAHNHPSGDPTPSGQDIACTKSLVSAGKIIGIEVLDHIVVGQRTDAGSREYVSFREEGLMAA